MTRCSSPFRRSAEIISGLKGDFILTREELRSSYAVIRHNIRTYESAGVHAVVKGRHKAESELKKLQDYQHSLDRNEGWRYFIEKTDLKPGTAPTTATRLRQAKLDGRESKALRELKNPLPAPKVAVS